MKQRIRLTESKLKKIISETVEEILKNSHVNYIDNNYTDLYHYTNQAYGAINNMRRMVLKYRNYIDPQIVRGCEEIYEMINNAADKIREISEPMENFVESRDWDDED